MNRRSNNIAKYYFDQCPETVVDIQTVVINRDILFTYIYSNGDRVTTDFSNYWSIEFNQQYNEVI